jgi:phosphoribosylformylglycinamidine cyclo-ligase
MTSYRDAGVDLEGAEELVRKIASAVTATWSQEVVGGFGGFAAGITLPEGYRNPVLMLSTDGVGTKLELARRSGRWGGVGYDLVAMGVDDLAAVGARAVAFVDYLAVGALNTERDTAIGASIPAPSPQIRWAAVAPPRRAHPRWAPAPALEAPRARSRSSTRRILPDTVLGRLATNSMARASVG